MTPHELREKTVALCRQDPVFFTKNFVHIEDKDAAELVQPFRLWPMQEDALRQLHAHRLNVILKARQLGITWLALSVAAWTVALFSGRTVVCFSRAEEEAKELVRRMVVILRHMPELICEEKKAPPGWQGPVFRHTCLSVHVRFAHGPESVLKAFLSSPGAARGFTADLVILDEWALQQYAEELWASIFPVVNRPGGGRVIGLSTIRLGTLFEEIFTNPDNGFHKIFLPWQADPARNQAWYARTLGALGEEKTLQEYPASVEEALSVPGGAMFPEVRAETHICEGRSVPENARRYVAIDYGLDMFSAHWVAVDSEGRALIYREYDAPNKTIGEAAATLLALSQGEDIAAFLAPPDLWSREQVTGRSRAALFSQNGVELTRASSDFAAGCAAMKEWLRPSEGGPRLRFLRRAAPNLWRCLQKIQKDEQRPDVYAKEPHALTHDVDSLRYFCVWWAAGPPAVHSAPRVHWEADVWEDYENAPPQGKAYLVEKYGSPF